MPKNIQRFGETSPQVFSSLLYFLYGLFEVDVIYFGQLTFHFKSKGPVSDRPTPF